MTTTLDVVTVPSTDTPGPCIFIHHDKHSYVFGRVAEGTQRAFNTRKISMVGTEQIFLSGSVAWEQVGGLIGYLLSIGAAAEATKEQKDIENLKRSEKGRSLLKLAKHGGVGVHGGDNLCHILAASRAVIFRQPISVLAHEHRQDLRASDPADASPDWEDDAIRVWKIPVRRARSSSPRKRNHNSPRGTGADSNGEQDDFKSRAPISDPEVAGLIVEKIMFNGNLTHLPLLPKRKLSELKPTDVALIREDGTLKRYKGPFAADGVALSNPDGVAWIFPGEGDTTKEGDDSLQINNVPLPRTAYTETSMSYIVKCHDRRGKFNPAKAKEYEVKTTDFKLLTKGESVIGKDGMTVTPEMVLGEPQLGRGVAIADIGSPDFLGSFLERSEWENAELMQNIAVMYWFLGPGMAKDARIQKFAKSRPQMRHVFCAEDTCPNMITNISGAEIQTKLRRVDADRFPLLGFNNVVKFPAPSAESPIELGRVGKKVHLMPRLSFDDQSESLFPDLLLAANSVDNEVLDMAKEARTQAADPKFLAQVEKDEKDIPNRDAEIIPLGTGSSVPSKHRNVSGTLIRVPGIGNYLLDCGEGTLGQIRRLLRVEEVKSVLRGLQCIVISHMHADHHLGTVSLIKAWYEQTLKDGSNAKLAISCIGRYRTVLEELSQIEDFGFHRLQFPSCPGPRSIDKDVTTSKDLGNENFGLSSIKRIPVPHCWRSYGTQLELTSGLRIAYSGDCRPSRDFAKACRGAHLLVHECTFGDDMLDHAKTKRHSTMGEALGVAAEMKARRTLLTHFSQRYSKSDSLRRERVEGEEQDVLLAFDFMRVKLGDFQKAALFLPAVELLMEKMGDKGDKGDAV